MNAIKAFLVIALLSLAHGCASQGEPQTIIQGKEGRLAWCLDLDLAIIEPLQLCINGERDNVD